MEVEFRTGKRDIPDYQAELMAGIDTHRLTYEQALRAMNRKLESDFVGRAIERHVADHQAILGRRR